MAESRYQKKVIRRLRRTFPGCEILKNDSGYIQGMLDLTVLWGPHWATLEVKDDERSPHQPNQDFYVKKHNDMSFSSFVFPQNEEEVFAALQEAFSSGRPACVPLS